MIEIVDCEQGDERWFEARRGVVTASGFSTILAKGRGGGESKMRNTYKLKLAGEILTGELMDNYSNAHMERGKEMESDARDLYAFVNDAPLTRVGFVRNGPKGCSPDSLIGDDGGLEIKTALPHIQIERLLKGTLPPEHMAQVQGGMWVCERKWWDLVSYWPNLPLFTVRVFRDEEYIAKLSKAVDEFNVELQEIVSKIKSYTTPNRDAA